MRKSAEQQLERRRYEAALAERQFNRVDPDNRLVAAELERRWEAALKEVRAAEEALARAASSQAIAPVAVVKAVNDNVIRLSGRLPEIWADPSTTAAGVLGIPVNWLYVQIRQGRLLIDRHPSGAHLFANTPPVIEAVRKLRNHEIERLDLRITEPHKEGHSHG